MPVDPRDQFTIHRLRAKPVEYSVVIRHFVAEGEWQMAIELRDVDTDQENRERIAADLEVAARWLRTKKE